MCRVPSCLAPRVPHLTESCMKTTLREVWSYSAVWQRCACWKCKRKGGLKWQTGQETGVSTRDRKKERGKGWEGFLPPQATAGSFAGLDSGREQTRRITPAQGRERERARERERKGRREKLECRESEGRTRWEPIGPGLCQSFHFLLGCGKSTEERAGGGRGRGRYPQTALSLSHTHTHTHTHTLCFFTKKTQLRLKLKQGKTRKSRAVSCSPSFSQFPVQGGHFVTQPGEGAQHLFGICFCLLTPTAGSFSIHFGLSPLQSNFFGRERWGREGRRWRRRRRRRRRSRRGQFPPSTPSGCLSFWRVSRAHCSCLSCPDCETSLWTREHERRGWKQENKQTKKTHAASWIRISSLICREGVDTGHRGTHAQCVCVCVPPSLLHRDSLNDCGFSENSWLHLGRVFVTVCMLIESGVWMANASPCMPSGAMAQVFFPPGGSSPPGSAVMQQGTPISMPSMPAQGGFPVMDLSLGQGPGGAVMPSLPPTPAGVSFIIQIGLTRESVLMPQSADLAYVKQIACSIVDTKVGNVCEIVRVCKTRGFLRSLSRWKAVLKPHIQIGFPSCLSDAQFGLYTCFSSLLSLFVFHVPVSHYTLFFFFVYYSQR